MRCPFPGMDPYIERRAIWPDFHDTFIAYIREILQPFLRPKYAALTQNRLYVVTEEIREPLLHIVEPAEGNRIITSIEILSPDNKRGGAGRDSLLQKRSELMEQGANTVEIDLLREGLRAIDPLPGKLEDAPGWSYLVSVLRVQSNRREYYPFSLRDRLPRIAIPLANSDPDVVLQLDAAFARCWETGPYPELLGYDGPPPGELDAKDVAWCREMVAAALTGAATKTST